MSFLQCGLTHIVVGNLYMEDKMGFELRVHKWNMRIHSSSGKHTLIDPYSIKRLRERMKRLRFMRRDRINRENKITF